MIKMTREQNKTEKKKRNIFQKEVRKVERKRKERKRERKREERERKRLIYGRIRLRKSSEVKGLRAYPINVV